jgi:hypothetical protein
MEAEPNKTAQLLKRNLNCQQFYDYDYDDDDDDDVTTTAMTFTFTRIRDMTI